MSNHGQRALAIGDELHCPQCGQWHVAFVKKQQAAFHEGMLFVTCQGLEYYVGREGGRSRWLRRENGEA